MLTALDALADVLYPHLDRKVTEGMPVVADTLTAAEWKHWHQAYNIKGRPHRQLGLTGHFLVASTLGGGYDTDPVRIVTVP